MEFMATGKTAKQFYEQYTNTAIPIVGQTYVIDPGSWMEKKIKIVSEYEDVVIGEIVKGFSVGEKRLYYRDGNKVGWEVRENRPSFRLQNIKKEKNDSIS